MNYIYVLISNVFLAFDFAIAKKYQSLEGTSAVPGLKFNALCGALTTVIFLALTGFTPGFSLYSFAMAAAMSLCAIGYSLIGFRLLRAGNIASYTLFLMTGGMVLPYIFGVVFLEEELSVLRVLGTAVILCAVVLSGGAQSKLHGKQFLLCLAVFFLNGGVSIISKCHQVTQSLPTVNSTAFVMYSGVGKALCSAAALAFLRPGKEKLAFRGKLSVPLVAGSALVGGLSYMLQLIGAVDIPATVLYPLITGGSIVFSALSGKVFFRERVTPVQWLSIGLCVLGTLLFL